MAITLKNPIPLIGSAGVFVLKTPFVTLPNERCECTAVRLISEYIAANEDPWTDVYKANNLSEAEYEQAKALNLQIITLVTNKGFRIQVPANYIDKYPVQDGVPYRGIGIYVALPAMPVDKNLDFLTTAIKEIVKSQVGVDSTTEMIETTAITMVPPDVHMTEEANRKLVIGSTSTPYAQIARLQNDLLDAQGQIQQLEAYILDHHTG